MRAGLRITLVACLGAMALAVPALDTTASPHAESLSTASPALVWSSQVFEERLVIGDVDGSPRRLLGPGRDPQISPDGRWIAYRDSETEHTYVVSSAGGDPWLVARRARPLGWASTSRQLLTVDGGNALSVTDVETRRRVTIDRGATILGASFSPSGTDVVWGRGPRDGNLRDGNVDVFRARTDGSQRRRLTRDGTSSYPVWGRTDIAFARVRSSGDPHYPIYELWTMKASGDGVKRVTRSSHAPVEWSVDGRRLLTSTVSTSGVVLSVLDMRARAIRPLIRGKLILPLSLSKDGRSVLAWAWSPVRKPEGDLVRVDWDRRRTTLVRDAGQGADWNL